MVVDDVGSDEWRHYWGAVGDCYGEESDDKRWGSLSNGIDTDVDVERPSPLTITLLIYNNHLRSQQYHRPSPSISSIITNWNIKIIFFFSLFSYFH